jgi:hypothetical protein
MALFYLGFLLGVPLGIVVISLLMMAGEEPLGPGSLAPPVNSTEDSEIPT